MRRVVDVLVVAVLFMFLGCNSANSRGIIKDGYKLKEYSGKKIQAEGIKSDVIWQHMIDPPPEGYPVITNFDIGDMQTVLYSNKEIECPGKTKVIGKVKEVKGSGKRSGGKGAKGGEEYTEYHIVVDDWECK